jgi:hypothetical protein
LHLEAKKRDGKKEKKKKRILVSRMREIDVLVGGRVIGWRHR